MTLLALTQNPARGRIKNESKSSFAKESKPGSGDRRSPFCLRNVLDEDRRDETRSLTRNKIFGTRWIGQGLKALLPPAAAAVPAIIKT
jgi:hypothetical protein